MARRIASLTITGTCNGLFTYNVIFALEAERNDRPVRSTFFEEDIVQCLDNSEILGKKNDKNYSPQQFIVAALNRARTLGFKLDKVLGYTEHYFADPEEGFHFRQSFLMKGPKIAKSR